VQSSTLRVSFIQESEMKTSLLACAIVLVLTPLFAFADVPCQCAAALMDGGPAPALTNASINWGTIATYPSPNPFNSGSQNQSDCDNKCLMRANSDPNFRNLGWWCTRINRPFQGTVILWTRLDVAPWHTLTTPNAGVNIKCCAVPPVSQGTQPACPAGFQLVPNAPDANRCAKAAGEISVMPYPPDRTPIGQWGFTMGKTIFQWGPPKQQQQATAPAEVRPCP
jgi:hypothetical protein